jgi:hypothetical protein
MGASSNDERWIEIDLSDVGLNAPLVTLGELAQAASHVYERFVRYADEGWQWAIQPGDREFDGWIYQMSNGELKVAGARLLARRVSADEPAGQPRPAHGVSAYRTRQLTGRAWTGAPGSKVWQPLSKHD